MKKQNSSISSFQWEITEFQLRQKQQASIIEKFLFPSIFLMFIFPQLGFVGILAIAVFYIKLNSNSKLQTGNVVAVEKYKIDNNGISINDVKQGKNSFYSWNDLSYFYNYSKTNPLFGLLFSKIVGDEFFVMNKDLKLIKLNTNTVDVEKIKFTLSKKLKFKLPTSWQTPSSSSSSSFKYSGIGLFGNWLSFPSSSNNNKQKKIGFSNRNQEKRFHEQTIASRINLQKEKEAFKNKLIIILYLIVAFFVTVVYLVYENKDSLSEFKNDSPGNVVINPIESEVSQENDNNFNISDDAMFWERKGCPKNEVDIVTCNQDSDCEIYFYFLSEKGKPVEESTPKSMNYYVNSIRDEDGCVWGSINRKYKKA
ncbi:MAG: hypothetical protein P1P85_03095 [Patescibacteria group bacterium]|nr:hypothetical protein [Patescibacteria group bacterium]